MHRTFYESTYEGKNAFVEEKLKPLILSMDTAWDDVEYVHALGGELVTLTNKNPDKTLHVNVTCDSIRALVRDVFTAIDSLYRI